MKNLQRILTAIAVLGLLAAAGCKETDDLSMQRSRIFLMGRLLAGKTCDVRLIYRVGPDESTPVKVTADLSEIGGGAEQELAPADGGTWRWSGQVTPDVQGERLIIITAVDQQELKRDVNKMFRVFNTDKAIAIAASPYSGLTLKADGTVVAWSFDDGSRFVTPDGLTDITAIAAGSNNQMLTLKADGTVAAWGCDTNPEFDYGLCDVPGGLNDVVAIAAGTHNIALKADGTVVAWGKYTSGMITPVYVPAGLADVVAIGAGDNRSAAVKADGTVVPWPHNYELRDVVSVSLGWYFDLAVQSDGTVVQIYDEKATALPIRVGRLKATATASGGWGNIALQQDGSVVVWATLSGGDRLFGTMVFHRLKNIIAVAAFGGSSQKYMALTESGSVIAWDEKWTEYKLTELPVPVELQ